MRSKPMPKAKPCHSSGSSPHARKTSGWTRPPGMSSIQPECLHTGQPVPEQKTHSTSTIMGHGEAPDGLEVVAVRVLRMSIDVGGRDLVDVDALVAVFREGRVDRTRLPLGGGFVGAGLVGSYYRSSDFSGVPVFSRRDVRLVNLTPVRVIPVAVTGIGFGLALELGLGRRRRDAWRGGADRRLSQFCQAKRKCCSPALLHLYPRSKPVS